MESVQSAMPVGMEEEVMSGEEGQRGRLPGEVKICVSVVGSKMWRCVEKRVTGRNRHMISEDMNNCTERS